MPKVPVLIGEWRPDAATLDSQFSNDVENVFPASDSYWPCPSLQPFSDQVVPPLPSTERICGAFSARHTVTGEWRVYAGTPTKLYTWTNTTGWVDITRTSAGYHVPNGHLWSFTQFGKWVLACQAGDAVQFADVNGGSWFDDLQGTFDPVSGETAPPPIAHTVHTIGDFVVLACLVDASDDGAANSIQWSGINDINQWNIGIGLCDRQAFPDHGPVMGVAGDKIGYVLQDRSIRTMQFLPQDTLTIFSFSQVVYDRGAISRYGYTTLGDTLYVLCEDGFYMVAGNQITPIGHEKVNEWFTSPNNSDIGRRDVVQCITAVKPYIFWAFHSGPAPNYYDRVILFNWTNQRWSKLAINAQVWATMSTVNVDLDTDFPPEMPDDALLDSNARGLDSFAYMGGRPRVAAIDEQGRLCDLTGPNLQATFETNEAHLVPGSRAMVGDVYPIADGIDGVIYDGSRERLQDDVEWSQAFPIELTGSAAVYVSARLHRFRHVIPRGTKWTHAQGVVADAQPDGTVA